ncbi:hypothetical protein Bbelb_049460 [Branchiostoma belcheri]|nr:hypothetical protein Bbelb_049460 [Branchiostoma belcheri]
MAGIVSVTVSGRSLVKMVKSNGPRQLPWGTPQCISLKEDQLQQFVVDMIKPSSTPIREGQKVFVDLFAVYQFELETTILLRTDRLRDTVHGYEEQWWNPQVDAVDAFTVSWSIILQGSIFSRFPLGFRMTASRFCPCGSCQPYPQGLRMPSLSPAVYDTRDK